jgi:hypothetical protein
LCFPRKRVDRKKIKHFLTYNENFTIQFESIHIPHGNIEINMLSSELQTVRLFRFERCHELTGCWWLTPVILATLEAEIGKIAARGQSRQLAHEPSSPK